MWQKNRGTLDPFDLICFIVVCNTAVITDYSAFALTLIPVTVDTLEMSAALLTCRNNGQNMTSVQWIHNTEEVTVEWNSSTCRSYAGFLENNPNLYSYSCTDGTEYTLSLKQISRDNNGDTWKCKIRNGGITTESNSVTIRVKVPVRVATINPNSNVLTLSDKETFEWLCTSSSCRPKPKFRWYITNGIKAGGSATILSETDPIEIATDSVQSYTSRLSMTLNRTLNGWGIFCGSQNFAPDFIFSQVVIVNIIYPPEGPPRIEEIRNGSKITVLKGEYVNLTCTVSGGNPLPILEWNKNNEMPQTVSGTTVTQKITWQANDVRTNELRCQSMHLYIKSTAYVSVNILYPPDEPVIKVKTASGEFLPLNKVLSVIEGRSFTLNCSADSNPPVTLFKWNDLLPTNSSRFYVDNVDNLVAETITCSVWNEMQIRDSSPSLTGNNMTYLVVNELYPPTINILKDKTVTEGDDLNYTCDFTYGNPSVTNITWSWNSARWHNKQLQINNVSRNQAGVYICSVQNMMISSDETKEFGNDSGEFQLSVQYKTKVLKFLANVSTETDNVAVNENDAVSLTCEIEGLPLPTGEMLYQPADFILNQNVKAIPRYSEIKRTKSLHLTSSFLAKCTDNGIQTCSGANELFDGRQTLSTKSISLFVKCKPRMSPYFNIPATVPSPTAVDVTLSFTALAYPVPPQTGYIWIKQVENSDTWINVTASGHKTIISTSGLQSNLTIKDVSQFDYGLYRISIYNDVGQFSHTFNLIPPESASSLTTSMVAPVSAGTLGGVVFVLAVIIIVILYKRRRGLSNTTQDNSSQYSNLNVPSDSYSNIPVDGDRSNVYEGLRQAGFCQQYEQLQPVSCKVEEDGSNIPVDGDRSNVYEGLRQTGFCQQYEQLQSVSCKVEEGQPKLYENLQLSCNAENQPVEDSSINVPIADQNEQTQTAV